MDFEDWVSTDEMAAELNRDRRTLHRWRKSGLLVPALHFVRGQGERSAMLWRKSAVFKTLAANTLRLNA
jgi:hypothetical protein